MILTSLRPVNLLLRSRVVDHYKYMNFGIKNSLKDYKKGLLNVKEICMLYQFYHHLRKFIKINKKSINPLQTVKALHWHSHPFWQH